MKAKCIQVTAVPGLSYVNPQTNTINVLLPTVVYLLDDGRIFTRGKTAPDMPVVWTERTDAPWMKEQG